MEKRTEYTDPFNNTHTYCIDTHSTATHVDMWKDKHINENIEIHRKIYRQNTLIYRHTQKYRVTFTDTQTNTRNRHTWGHTHVHS